MRYELMETPGGRLTAWLLYNIEWIVLTTFLIVLLGLGTGYIVGQNSHIRDMEQVINQNGVTCKRLLDDPVVKRIMGAK